MVRIRASIDTLVRNAKPRWVVSTAFALTNVWLVLFLQATGEEVLVDPLRDGTLLIFTVVFVFTSLGAYLTVTAEASSTTSSDRLISAFGFAGIIGVLAIVKYGLIIVNGTSATPETHHPLLGIGFAVAALVFGWSCERSGSNLRRGRQ